MKIKILYDNKTSKKNILAGWGFSCFVDDRILFDTGEKSESLLNNMKEMGVDAARIREVVISHDHWDHTGGLPGILKGKEVVKVYICHSFGAELRNEIRSSRGFIIEPADFREISENIFATGPIHGKHKSQDIEEQALVASTPKGISVITGCAHPGIVKMVERAKKEFPDKKIYSVIGGFHLKDKGRDEIVSVVEELKALGVEKAGPAHCTGEEAINIFKESFKDNFIPIAAGEELEV